MQFNYGQWNEFPISHGIQCMNEWMNESMQLCRKQIDVPAYTINNSKDFPIIKKHTQQTSWMNTSSVQ